MGKFVKTVDIWALDHEKIKGLQPGQWVKAGSGQDANTGRYMGVRASGSVVVAWHSNAKRQYSYYGYLRTLREYARGERGIVCKANV